MDYIIKRRLGFHTDSKSMEGHTPGGSDLYFKKIIENIDLSLFEVYFFIPSKYYLRNETTQLKNIKTIVYDEEIKVGGQKYSYASATKNKQISFRFLWHRFCPNALKFFAGCVKDVFKFRGLFARYRLDILHSIEGGPEPAIIGAYLAGVPIRIASYCVPPYTHRDKSLTGRIRRLIERVTIHCASNALVKSKSARSIWSEYLNVSCVKFSVIPNGINLSQFDEYDDPIMLKKLHDEFDIGEKFVVGITARLDQQKGHVDLIKAAAEVIKVHKEIVFLCVGDGPMRKELEALVWQSGLANFFKFLGFRNDVCRITWVYDVAILPSICEESFGWAIVEGMVCRKPVIATSIGGIPEIVLNGVTGLLVSPGDSSAIAKSIYMLVKDEIKRRVMGDEGRMRVEQLFTERQMLEKTYALYNV